MGWRKPIDRPALLCRLGHFQAPGERVLGSEWLGRLGMMSAMGSAEPSRSKRAQFARTRRGLGLGGPSSAGGAGVGTSERAAKFVFLRCS